MIALPFHPSNGFEIDELNENLEDILHEVELEAAKIGEGKTHFSLLDKIVDGKLHVQQGVIAGCSGGNYDSVVQAARVLKGANTGCGEFSLSVYPTSQPVALELTRRGYIYDLMEPARSCARHSAARASVPATRPPTTACRSATLRATSPTARLQAGQWPAERRGSDGRPFHCGDGCQRRHPDAGDRPAEDTWTRLASTPSTTRRTRSACTGALARRSCDELVEGPNIKPWPAMEPLGDDILLKVCSKIMDPVTTTDELIPSGETSSFRSNRWAWPSLR